MVMLRLVHGQKPQALPLQAIALRLRRSVSCVAPADAAAEEGRKRARDRGQTAPWNNLSIKEPRPGDTKGPLPNATSTPSTPVPRQPPSALRTLPVPSPSQRQFEPPPGPLSSNPWPSGSRTGCPFASGPRVTKEVTRRAEPRPSVLPRLQQRKMIRKRMKARLYSCLFNPQGFLN